MELKGSCHCGAVGFTVNSRTPYPFNYCYCAICRKTGGGGGYAVNIMAESDTLKIEGEEHINVYRSSSNHEETYEEDGLSSSRRHFCSKCGSALWVSNPKYSQWLYPFASAIDTSLPIPPERVHLMTEYKTDWVPLPDGDGETHFAHYPDLGIEDWHKKHGLLDES